MCGIAGFWCLNKKNLSNLENNIKNMTNILSSRGPNDKGYWIDRNNSLAFGHRRLSILEISKLGKQPMISRNKRFVISYNGEIYNYLKIKKELEDLGVNFRSNCDTEILIESISYWGIEKTLKKICGMFSFAIWDRKEKKIYLVRDRVGIKPLYWSYQNNTFFFGSQPKCFIANKLWKKNINQTNLLVYFQFGYISPPNSVYKETFQLQPGHFLEINNSGNYKIKKYWDLGKNINKTKYKNIHENEITEELKILLKEVVGQHLLSDVPLGTFLSGGIDSSVISLITSQNKRKVNTYSAGYNDENLFDETKYAKKIANILGTNHTHLRINPNDILNDIPRIVEEFDEPFSDSSQLPTFLLSKLVKKEVTVCLSGDGGDELFGGYNRYLFASKLKTIFFFLPYFLRKQIANYMFKISPHSYDNFLSIFGNNFHKTFNGDKIHKFLEIMQIKDFNSIYNHLLSFFPIKDIPVTSALMKLEKNPKFNIHGNNFIEQMQLTDLNFYLPGDILTKVDRASMAHSLEIRVPFLDHRIIEFAFSLPQNMKIKNRQTKKVLRNILLEKIDKKYINRPKMGFAIPLVDWLRGPLKEWAFDLINQPKLNDGIIDTSKVKKIFEEHVTNKRNWQNKIWTILVYIIWRQKYIN